jgi:Domain of unknown function (DUF4283)
LHNLSSAKRGRVYEKGPWHFKQDVLGLKKLVTAPIASDGTAWTSLVWVQFHSKVLRNLSKEAICRLAENIGTVFDMELEGREKWGCFARIRVIIDPCLPLKDIITLNL